MVQPLWKTAGQFLKNLKLKLSHDPEILLLGIYSRYQKHVHKKKKQKHLYMNVHNSIIYKSQKTETTQEFISWCREF